MPVLLLTPTQTNNALVSYQGQNQLYSYERMIKGDLLLQTISYIGTDSINYPGPQTHGLYNLRVSMAEAFPETFCHPGEYKYALNYERLAVGTVNPR